MMPNLSASSALTGLPLVHISTAFAMPASLRKALSSPRAGNKAELHFRLADLGGRYRNAIVAGHRQFQSAAKSRTVNGNDHGLSAVFDLQAAMGAVQRRAACLKLILPNSLMSAPATNVRPAADQNGGFDAVVLCDLVQRLEMPSGTPGLKAFTGGLLMVIIATPLSFVSCTSSVIERISRSGDFYALFAGTLPASITR